MKKKMQNILNPSYQTLLAQVQALDIQIGELSNQIHKIKKEFEDGTEEDMMEEVCLDEVEANKAALEAMKNICLEVMLTGDPQGEA